MNKFGLTKIIGKTINSYTLSPDQTVLTLQTDDGSLVFETYGDCCSETWIEHVTSPKFPAKIISLEEKYLGSADGTRQEYDEKYSTIFLTDQGNFEVEYRNSSNGYYGGSLELVEPKKT